MAILQRIVKSLFFVSFTTAFLWCSMAHGEQSTGQYIDDSVITTKVKAAIVDDMSLKGFKINVKTYKGVVQLSCFVNAAEKASKAGDLARGVKGVAEVKNNLIVK